MVNSGRAPILSAASSSASATLRGQMRNACRPPRRGQLGQRLQCLLGAAEMIDEFAERDGADVVAADQAQARQALCGVERRLRQRRRRQPRAQLS